jgi:hypothetical protein
MGTYSTNLRGVVRRVGLEKFKACVRKRVLVPEVIRAGMGLVQ